MFWRSMLVVTSLCLAATAFAEGLDVKQISTFWTQTQEDLLACHLMATTRPVNFDSLRTMVDQYRRKWEPIATPIENTTDAETPEEFFGAYLQTLCEVLATLNSGNTGDMWQHLESDARSLDLAQRQFIAQWPRSVPLSRPLRESWFSGAKQAMAAAIPTPKWRRLDLNDYPTDFAEEGPQSRFESIDWLRTWVQNAETHRSEITRLVKAGQYVQWQQHFEYLYTLQGFGSKCVGVSRALQSAVNVFPLAQFNAWARQSQTRELSTPESREADRVLTAVKARLRAEQAK